MGTPATSTLVSLSHTCLGYSSFYRILMPAVSKIFCSVYPEEKKKKIFTIYWLQFLWRPRSYFDPKRMAYFYPVFRFGEYSNTKLKLNI